MKKIISTLIMIMTISLILLPQAMADLNDDLVAYWPFTGNANDESGNRNDGAVFEAKLCEDRFGNNEGAYCFDGVNDYINIGNNVKPPFPFTVSTWIKAKDFHFGKFFSNDYNNDTSVRYGINLITFSNGLMASETFEGFSAPWNRISKWTNARVLTIGKWHHFAVVLNAHNNMQLFWDGSEVDGTYAGSGSSMQYSNGDGWIGKEHANKYPYKGALDDIRVYNRALSNSEILDLHNEKCSFVDVPPGYWAEEHICKIYEAGITKGCSQDPLMYCPKKDVTREQMAAFLVRAVEGEPPANYCDTGSPFSDVDPASLFCKYIKRLSELEITKGCGGGNYCPKTTVKREQMAAFLVRAVEGEPPANYCGTGSPFPDVPSTSVFCKYIKRLSELGITEGCGGGKYCPKNTVKRDQMAVFLGRAFLGMD